MPRFDDYDLDVKAAASGSDTAQPKVTSVVACTPGTCWSTCGGESTLISNCCIGSSLCSLSDGCR